MLVAPPMAITAIPSAARSWPPRVASACTAPASLRPSTRTILLACCAPSICSVCLTAVTARARGEARGTGQRLRSQRRLPERELRRHRGRLIEPLLGQHRRTITAQAELRERRELRRQL